MSSITINLWSYNHCARQVLLESALRAAIPLPLALFMVPYLVINRILHPQFELDDGVKPESEDFPLTELNQKTLEKIADQFLKYRVKDKKGASLLDKLTDDQKVRIRSLIIQSCTDHHNLCQSLAKRLKIVVTPYISIDPNVQPGDDYGSLTAMGNQGITAYSLPAIIQYPPMIIISNIEKLSEELEEEIEGFKDFESDEFVIAHEFMHIMNRDTLMMAIIDIALIIFSSILWVKSLRSSSSWVKGIIVTFKNMLLLEVISTIFRKYIHRFQEKRADIQALNFLGSNASALKHFESRINRSEPAIDLEHPSFSERLNYIRAWKKK